MRAAAEAGIAVPKLCATDSVEAFGSCRLCVVEIEGRRGTPASCTTPVAEGMVVHTQAEGEEDPPRRDGALYLRPPARLPDLRGQRRLRVAGHGRCRGPARCALRGARRRGLANHFEARNTSGEANPEWIAKDTSNPYFTYDPSKCIVCSRCVRACEEVQGTFALTIEGRGFDSRVSAGGAGDDFLSSDCVSCGACVQACPTATLQEKSVIELGTPTRSVVTTCAYCGVGCSFKAELNGDELVRMVPYKHGKANRGHSCVKGRFAWGYANHAERILNPMIRDTIDEPWREVSWEEAMAFAATRLKGIQERYGKQVGRCHHLQPLHQRGDLPRAEADARGVPEQQHRHLRAGLPFAHRLRPRPDLRHLRRHAGFRQRDGGGCGRRHRREPDRWAPGLRLAAEEAAAGGCEADRDRPAPDRPGEIGAYRGGASPALRPGTNVAV
jgi:formate dehydrogenase major subunit